MFLLPVVCRQPAVVSPSWCPAAPGSPRPVEVGVPDQPKRNSRYQWRLLLSSFDILTLTSKTARNCAPSTSGVKKPHRYKLATIAFREVCHYQEATKPVICELPFPSSILFLRSLKSNLRIQPSEHECQVFSAPGHGHGYWRDRPQDEHRRTARRL